MQQHTYTAKRRRIIGQSFLIWFFLATQIAFNLFLLRGLANNGVTVLLVSNVVPGVLSIPGVFLFFNYYKHSAHKKFIVTYNSLKYFDEKTGLAVELRNEDIEHVYIVENVKGSKFPWASHQYFAFADKNGKTIIITCYLMDIGVLDRQFNTQG